MGNITLLGIDLAKNVFQLHGVDTKGKAILRKKVKRDKLANFIANLPNCRIVMEACGGANYWARRFQLFGHTVQLISPQFVKPFVKTNKNDQNDAEAIVEAASRPSMRYVTAKTIEQQDIQNLHRIRTRLVKQRTALGNQIRGILGEYGLVVPKSLRQLRSQVALILEDADNELTILTREVINELMEELNVLDERIESYEKRLDRIIKGSEPAKRLMTIPGVGEISSTAVIAAVGNADAFKNGRQLAAWLGLVPRQSSSSYPKSL